MTTLPLDKIVVAGRHRNDLGDLDSLVDSLRALGLLHPVVVDSKHQLVAGERRLAAIRRLGWSEVPVTVVNTISDAGLALAAERDENTCRKDLTPSELVGIGLHLERIERDAAAQRQSEAGQQYGRGQIASGPRTGSYQETREAVGHALGVSGRTYERAKSVVTATSDPDPEVAEVAIKAQAEMDATGVVKPAAEKVRAAKVAQAEKSQPRTPAVTETALREMASSGLSSRQMAERLGVGFKHIRSRCRQHGVDVPADQIIGRTRMHDSNRIVSEMTYTLDGCVYSLGLVDLDDLDPDQAEKWVASLSDSLRSLNRFLKQMKETTRD